MNPYGEFIVEYDLVSEILERVITKRMGVGHNWNEDRATKCAGDIKAESATRGIRVKRIEVMHFDPERREYRKW